MIWSGSLWFPTLVEMEVRTTAPHFPSGPLQGWTLTFLADPGGGAVLRGDHLAELVPDEAQDVAGGASLQEALLQHPGEPQGQGLLVKLLGVGEAVHADHPVLTVRQPGGGDTRHGPLCQTWTPGLYNTEVTTVGLRPRGHSQPTELRGPLFRVSGTESMLTVPALVTLMHVMPLLTNVLIVEALG